MATINTPDATSSRNAPPSTDSNPSSPIFLAPLQPDPAANIIQHPKLTAEQQSKLQSLISHFNTPALSLPLTVKDAKAAQKARGKASKDVINEWLGRTELGSSGRILSDRERAWLTSEQLQRFLRAVKWDVGAALMRAEETVVWRREFGVDALSADSSIVEEEARTGKEIVMGWDVNQRPCLYMFPYRQNTKETHRQIQFVVWTLERAIDLMPTGVEKLCLLIDFGSGKGGGQPTSMGQAKRVLDILQTYYCERLGRAVCINVPTIFYGFYRLISPFVDPVTKDKIRFNPDVRTLVPPSQLDKEFGGDSKFEYKHDAYYSDMHKRCLDRREEMFARWQKLGDGKVGVSEHVLKHDEETFSATHPSSNGTPLKGTAAGLAATLSPTTNTSSPAASIRSAGYVLPAEAEHAPDWVEHEDSTSAASGQSSHNTSRTPSLRGSENVESPTKASARPKLESIVSEASFASANIAPAIAVQKARDDDAVEQAANLQTQESGAHSSDAIHEGLVTGIQGLVVHEDGSIGRA